MTHHKTEPGAAALRARRLSLLARAETDELSAALERHWPDLAFRDLRGPETGLVMTRGRMGGDGAPFNLGEATMSRCVVEIAGGMRGYGQLLGRRPDDARRIALVDALALRSEADAALIESAILAPLRARLDAGRASAVAETAATRVDFFTLVRGDNA